MRCGSPRHNGSQPIKSNQYLPHFCWRSVHDVKCKFEGKINGHKINLHIHMIIGARLFGKLCNWSVDYLGGSVVCFIFPQTIVCINLPSSPTNRQHWFEFVFLYCLSVFSPVFVRGNKGLQNVISSGVCPSGAEMSSLFPKQFSNCFCFITKRGLFWF